MNSGKSTLAKLLAAELGVQRRSLDDLRWDYYAEVGYDEKVAGARGAEGFAALYQYWKPFEAHAVTRILATHSNCVIDFGAGHSVYDDEQQFNQVRQALEPHRVVLTLPSPDPEESIRTLHGRSANLPDDVRNVNEYFVRHHSNFSLAKLIVYTNGKTPVETRDEILRSLKEQLRSGAQAVRLAADRDAPASRQRMGSPRPGGASRGSSRNFGRG